MSDKYIDVIVADRTVREALLNAAKTGGIGYTEADGTVHKISDTYGGGGGGYDLLFVYAKNPEDYDGVDLSKLSIKEGSFEAVEAKLANGTPVNVGLQCIWPHDGFFPCAVYAAIKIDIGYRFIAFSSYTNSPQSCEIVFDSSYEITSMEFDG